MKITGSVPAFNKQGRRKSALLFCWKAGFQSAQRRISFAATVKAMLAPLARPLDIHLCGRGKVYVSEYTRTIALKDSLALPGRILELAVKRSDNSSQ